MKKIGLLIGLAAISFTSQAQWISGGTPQTITSGNKQIRFNFGSSGFTYGYTKGQIDSLLGTVVSGVSSFNGRTGAITPLLSDYSSFYPSLTGSYSNPSWITSLAYSKLTGIPSSISPSSVNIGDTTRQKIVIYFKGTSITKTYGIAVSNPILAYADSGLVYKTGKILGAKVVNIGWSGRTTQTFSGTDSSLYRTRTAIPAYSAGNYLVYEGIVNDANLDSTQFTPAIYRVQIDSVINASIAAGWPTSHIILANFAYFNNPGSFTYPHVEYRHDLYSAQMQAEATARGCLFYDGYYDFKAAYLATPSLLYPDVTHPTSAGGTYIANKFSAFLSSYISKVQLTYPRLTNLYSAAINGDLTVGQNATVYQNLRVNGRILTPSLNIGNGYINPIPAFGTGVTFTPFLAATSASGQAGIEVGVVDGTNNIRAGLVVDNTSNKWGLVQSYSAGNPDFVIKSLGTNILTISPTGNIRAGTTWNGTPIGVTYGGTNSTTSPLTNQILVAASTTTYNPVTVSGDLTNSAGVFTLKNTGTVGTYGQVTTDAQGRVSSGTVISDVSHGGSGVATITGLIKGNGASPYTAAVAGTDYVTPASLPTAANPTATAGTSAVNGSATTYMRSDAAPKVDTTSASGFVTRNTQQDITAKKVFVGGNTFSSIIPYVYLVNRNAATGPSANQASPALNFSGNAWGTTAGASQAVSANIFLNSASSTVGQGILTFNLTNPSGTNTPLTLFNDGRAQSPQFQQTTYTNGALVKFDANGYFVAGPMPGSLANRTTVSDANYTALSTDYMIAYTSLTASRTVTLITLTVNQVQVVKDEAGTAGTNSIVVNAPAGKTIDGATSKTINTNYGSIKVYYNGTNFFTTP